MGLFRFSSTRKRSIKVSVQLLDDDEIITSEFKLSEPAQAILDYVLEAINIKESDYFGLRYQDHNKHRYWIDLSRSIAHIAKQFKFTVPDTLMLRLRFRFYPNNPHLLKEEITRYQLFVQLQRDLLHGRLYCPQHISAHLAALILQSQLGDYSEEKHGKQYASEYKLLLKQTPKIEERIEELHREMKGKLTASEAELEFLERACKLDTYGFDPYTAKENRDSLQPTYVGVTHRGIMMYKGNMKAHAIPWDKFAKVDYSGHEVRIVAKPDYVPPTEALSDNSDTVDKENKKSTLASPKRKKIDLRLECPSTTYARHLWTHILSQKAFFTASAAADIKPVFSKPRIPILGRGSTFRFPSRRVLHEIEAHSDEVQPREVEFSRYTLPKQERRPDAPWLTRYNTLPVMKTYSHANGVLNKSLVEQPVEEAKQESLLDEMERIAMVPSRRESEELQSTKANIQPTSSMQPSPEDVAQAAPPDSTPTADRDEQKREELRRRIAARNAANSDNKEATNGSGATTTFVQNGTIPNGTTTQPIEEREPPPQPLRKHSPQASLGSKLFDVFVMSLLITILISGICIALFENKENDWVSSNAVLTSFRHNVYNPARETITNLYSRAFSS